MGEAIGKPIIFSGPMVKALLDGRKTQTRRILKPQPEMLETGYWHVAGLGGGMVGVKQQDIGTVAIDYVPWFEGQRLWVREKLTRHQTFGADYSTVHYPADHTGCYGRNGAPECAADGRSKWLWKRDSIPSIHMPRWASRLTLEVTDVRVERLNDISEADAIAEGAEWVNPPCSSVGMTAEGVHGLGGQIGFSELWDSIHGDGAWDANPWVCAIGFSVHHCNIDAMPASLPSPVMESRDG